LPANITIIGSCCSSPWSLKILVAERDPEHPLTDQGRNLMLDVFRTPLVVKAQRKPVHHSDRSIGRAEQQRSPVKGDQPGIECRFHTVVGEMRARWGNGPTVGFNRRVKNRPSD
jgi:hypothetical protein